MNGLWRQWQIHSLTHLSFACSLTLSLGCYLSDVKAVNLVILCFVTNALHNKNNMNPAITTTILLLMNIINYKLKDVLHLELLNAKLKPICRLEMVFNMCYILPFFLFFLLSYLIHLHGLVAKCMLQQSDDSSSNLTQDLFLHLSKVVTFNFKKYWAVLSIIHYLFLFMGWLMGAFDFFTIYIWVVIKNVHEWVGWMRTLTL